MDKKSFIIFEIGLLILVLIGGAILFWEKNKGVHDVKNAPGSDRGLPDELPRVKIETDNAVGRATVRYFEGKFRPDYLEVSKNSGFACLVEIRNQSQEEVVIRLGPYSPKDDRGFAYSSIAPGKSQIIDPRYGQISEAVFYNRNNPKAEFKVKIDPSCYK